MAETLVETLEVGRTYTSGDNAVVALASATCHVCPGDRIAIVGPSGSGKSTLLHLLGGLDSPTSGKICWPAMGVPQSLRPSQVAFVFQMPSLLAALSVVENVELPLLLGAVGAVTARKSAMRSLFSLGLEGLADKLPEELSGGQAQRVAMARAIVFQPRLILADEPTGQLDHPTAMHLFDVLLSALAGSPTALVVATHDLGVADRMDTIWRIEHGTLEDGDR